MVQINGKAARINQNNTKPYINNWSPNGLFI